MRIVILDGYTENPGDLSWEGFERLGELTVYDRTPAELVSERIGEAEIVLTNKTPVSAEVINNSPRLSYIGVLATGYNIVDVEAAAKRGIPVCNIPSYGTAAVAQMVFALLLEVCHHVGSHSRSVKEGRWGTCPDWCFWDYPLIELAGKTFGVIGFGRIGQETAKIAAAFGMRVLACDEYPTEEGRKYGEYVSLERLLAESDVISLHCPLFPETKEMINRETIGRMKDGVILINTSRGPLINEADLAQALESGKIYGACSDVVSSEPISEDNPLLNQPSMIITPHIAWAPKESRERLMRTAVENLESFLGGTIVNSVNGVFCGGCDE